MARLVNRPFQLIDYCLIWVTGGLHDPLKLPHLLGRVDHDDLTAVFLVAARPLEAQAWVSQGRPADLVSNLFFRWLRGLAGLNLGVQIFKRLTRRQVFPRGICLDNALIGLSEHQHRFQVSQPIFPINQRAQLIYQRCLIGFGFDFLKSRHENSFLALRHALTEDA